MQVLGQIYAVTNLTTYDQYIGQTKTHYNKNGKLVIAGYERRRYSMGMDLATMVVYQENKLKKQVYFGGRYILFADALNDAIRLAEMLVNKENIYYQDGLI